MKHTIRILAVTVAALALPAFAQQPAPKAAPQSAAQPATKPQVVDAAAAGEVTTLTAKIEAIDLASRVVAVKGPLGRTVALKVDDKVKNLAQVKVGDEIVLKYFDAVSVSLVKNAPGGRSATTTSTGPVAAPAGSKPGVAMAQQTKIVAKVESVDAKRQVVLLEGPGGKYAEVKVKDANVFKDIKAGDNVDVTFTEALVVDVVTPKAK